MGQDSQGEGEEGYSQGSSGLCQEKGETYPSERKKHLSQRKMAVLGGKVILNEANHW